ncbi:Uncharacterized protein TCM_038867 [Theobroma cacao]|uniref:Uncharacterized protein n=1 Tax=Theobroma cacao TaxID=3641 RepID=A0A061GPJ6_THECC|nr:Uncharacterized protein TCM_038867 [Theobroma cacao]
MAEGMSVLLFKAKKADRDELKRMKWFFRIYQAMSGSKVNFHKSELFGVAMDKDEEEEWSREIKCKGWEIKIWRMRFYMQLHGLSDYLRMQLFFMGNNGRKIRLYIEKDEKNRKKVERGRELSGANQ